MELGFPGQHRTSVIYCLLQFGRKYRNTPHSLEARGGDAIGTKHVLAGSYFAAWLGRFLMERLVPYRLDMYR